jgi:hypothetical protein
MVTRKSKWDGIIVNREVDEDGRVYCYDKNERLCWDMNQPERVVLVEDLRCYAAGLHVGQLGWTVPETCDGYKWVDVQFDNGVRLPILTFGLERVLPEKAQSISEEMIAANRGTMHDADPVVAEEQRVQHVRSCYSPFVDAEETFRIGAGPEELYAFTFPSLRELAQLKGNDFFPVKVGYTRAGSGCVARIASMMNLSPDACVELPLGMQALATVGEGMGESAWVERAGYPEKAELLLVCATDDGRSLEVAVHRELRGMDRHVKSAVGKEWFNTNAKELKSICQRILNK